jgi:homocysteine S-methyltransferase
MELTDGGVATYLLFHEGLDLPCFASFPLLDDEQGRAALRRYFERFIDIADRHTINGVVGPRGDGYVPGEQMSAADAADYHGWQIGVLRAAGVDRITALTLTYPGEAIGIVQAAAVHGVPVAAGFTVETDGRLPDGTTIADAVAAVDTATGGAADFFLINCAYPTHIAAGLDGTPQLRRIGGLRVNASALSHDELDAMEELDEGDPVALARDNAALHEVLPSIRLLGGCCGTDHRHVSEIVAAWPE